MSIVWLTGVQNARGLNSLALGLRVDFLTFLWQKSGTFCNRLLDRLRFQLESEANESKILAYSKGSTSQANSRKYQQHKQNQNLFLNVYS